MQIRSQVSLKPFNTLGLPVMAAQLIHLHDERDVRAVVDHPQWGRAPKLILGGGSNVVLTGDVPALVLKVDVRGRRLLETRPDAWIVEVGAGESWHDTVMWTLDQGWPGLENMALIPGSMGAAPVQNIGAYGLELQDRLLEVEGVDLRTGLTRMLPLNRLRMGYRDSIFKHELAGQFVITRVRLRLPRPWRPELAYQELARWVQDTGESAPTPLAIAQRVMAVRRAKLPDPAVLGNVGSFFKNPVVSEAQCMDIIGRDPHVVHYLLPDGRYKLAAGWLIDACGWKGKTCGQAGVYDRQALVLVNHGQATGAEIMTLAAAIQESVYGRFGIRLEPEPVVI